MKKGKSKKMCLCCKYYPAVGTRTDLFAIPEFCSNCNLNRCDTFPGTCWSVPEEKRK